VQTLGLDGRIYRRDYHQNLPIFQLQLVLNLLHMKPCDSVVYKRCSHDQWVSGSIPRVARNFHALTHLIISPITHEPKMVDWQKLPRITLILGKKDILKIVLEFQIARIKSNRNSNSFIVMDKIMPDQLFSLVPPWLDLTQTWIIFKCSFKTNLNQRPLLLRLVMESCLIYFISFIIKTNDYLTLPKVNEYANTIFF